MLSGIGAGGFIMIALIALLLFGPKKLPEIGKAFGQTLREFKKSTREFRSDIEKDVIDIPEKDKD